ncbi:hypothetical protein BS329_15790 [Amycolatopsis coloradensis]|uniref:Uncharacterized protein n=1 Tax=Amycolatopsis coloradensis TaxID=76021 RepID=A0A1R0KUE4_9PSEU|nr:hypothetical protein [Amycolatopsis coloradensis]OLZ51724.1 hypothetical protein BS329_15790 [Amycolatopsis coloradensis]
MTIIWTETTTAPTVSSREANLDPDHTIGDIYTRTWERERRGIRELIWLYVAHWGSDEKYLTRWEYEAYDGDEVIAGWTSDDAVIVSRGNPNTERLIAGKTPDDLPDYSAGCGGCPAWGWTMVDVAEYRGLASADSARRWIAERSGEIGIISRDVETGAKIINGCDVVRVARSMVGRGKGGGRPSKTTSV